VSLGQNGGKRVRLAHSAKTMQDARRWLTAAKSDHDKGRPIESGRQTVAHLTTWLDSMKPSLKPGTWVRYRQTITLHAIPFIGHLPLAKLEAHHLRSLYANRLEAKAKGGGELSPSSVRQLHANLGKAIKQAVRDGAIQRDVASLVDAPRLERHEMHTLSPEQTEQLLEAARGDPLEALYVLAVTTGMRQGELLAIKWRDVDLEGGSLSVHTTLRRVDGALAFSEPKTKRSNRRIDLSQRAVAALRQHRARQKEARLKHLQAWEDLDLVFTNEIGRPVEATNLVGRSYKPLLERAGLARIRFHDLRHTAATLLLGKGLHPKIVSEMLGHSSIAITLDLYSHVTPTMQREAAAAMDALLGS
jgi:integrase